MEYDFQSTGHIDGFLTSYVNASPNPRLRSVFRNAREREEVSLIGDFPLLAHIVYFLKDKNITYNRVELHNALRESSKFQEMSSLDRKKIVDQLSGKGEL